MGKFPMGVARISEGGCAVEDEFREITHNNGHTPLGHSTSPILIPMGKHVCGFLCVHNSNLRPIFTFPRYDGLLVQFSLSQRGVSV